MKRYLYSVTVAGKYISYEMNLLARDDTEARALAVERARERLGLARLETLKRVKVVETADDEATRLRAENAKLAAEVRRLAARLDCYEPADRGYFFAAD